jgi:hypothetical protein
MNIFMWSGPRNLSTALMRSFENREDTKVWDEPLYAYYLNETKKDHPMFKEIIETYEININKLTKRIVSTNKDEKITYQKHMSHHILSQTPINWITKGANVFLIRDPKDVILSYIQKNTLNNSDDIGFPMQRKLFNLIKDKGENPIVVNADDLSRSPKDVLIKLCSKLKIKFSEKMLTWNKGKRDSDGIWEKVWYKNVQSSTNFEKLKKNDQVIPKVHENIYKECLDIYNELNLYKIKNAR